ncbi:divisome protein SepX/GlpR [Streptomyces sp. CA-294286]|uniref:divisome protein SepX/GlpR n=1 Tax=Streptomyces sp. CA-294286 TaxID=3240070 RepID=UPI003D8D27F3
MSSSGLIYAVIVGAWAAYLVPMWLRRQDELNEARPTERFSTAIRLLSGRAAMERRYAKELRQRDAEDVHGDPDGADGREPGDPDARNSADTATDSVDVRAFATPPARTEHPAPARRQSAREHAKAPVRESVPEPEPARDAPAHDHASRDHSSPHQSARDRSTRDQVAREPERQREKAVPVQSAREQSASAERARRSKVLARRRRTTVMLFAAFTLGAIVAAVGGLAYLWAPGVPAVLLSAYIVHLRGQEKRRFVFTMDRRRAELAAQRLREQRTQQVRRPAPPSQQTPPAPGELHPHQPHQQSHQRHPRQQHAHPYRRPEPGERPEPEPAPVVSPQEAGRRALVEQTDHAEWVDQQRERERGAARGESWEPVPVPLPTYVTAPVAPRANGDLDLGAPDTWSAARSSTADPTPPAEDVPSSAERRPSAGRRSRDRGRTPLFDQYDDDDERPRAANE